jgi:LAO/AO transport system kinase
VPVLTVSALQQEGVHEVWAMLNNFRAAMQVSGEFVDTPRRQAVDWMWALLMDDLKQLFLDHPEIKRDFPQLQQAVAQGITTPAAASKRLLDIFKREESVTNVTQH